MKARLITPTTQAAKAVAGFRDTYDNERWRDHVFPDGRTVRGILDAFAAIKGPPRASDVTRVCGNNRWSRRMCNGCGKWGTRAMVEVGDEPDYESATVTLCRRCLAEAVEVLGG